MMNRKFKFLLALSAPALLLAGCSAADDGSGDTDGDGAISADEMTAAAEGLEKLQPGAYKMDMELVEIVDPNVSAEQIKQAKEGFAMMSGMRPPRCITGEDDDEGLVGLAKELQSGECETTKLNSSSSKLTAEMTCTSAQGKATVAMEGTSTGTSSEMLMTITQPAGEGESASEDGPKKAVMRVSMERTGDCEAEG